MRETTPSAPNSSTRSRANCAASTASSPTCRAPRGSTRTRAAADRARAPARNRRERRHDIPRQGRDARLPPRGRRPGALQRPGLRRHRQRRPSRAGAHQPRGQRDLVLAQGRRASGRDEPSRRAHRDHRGGRGPRHRGGQARHHLRSLLHLPADRVREPRRQLGARAVNLARDRRCARRADLGGEPDRGGGRRTRSSGLPLRGSPAGEHGGERARRSLGGRRG